MGPGGALTTPAYGALDLRRARLLALLERGAGRRLTLVVAPAGYGKTALLTSWATEHAADLVAWMTARDDDNDRAAFADRLRRVRRRIRGAPSATLVVDDFQRVTDRSALDVFAAFVEDAPPNLRLLVASRVDLPPRLYRFRLADDLAAVGADDLAFTSDELAELVERTAGPVSAADVDELYRATEGWPVGVNLGALALREGDSMDHIGAVDQYLATEVLSGLGPELRDFMKRTSVLDAMSAPLCDFVLSQDHSRVMLADLESRGAFVASAPSRPGWFRYHPMMRATLRRLDGGIDDVTETELLRRAARWHRDRGELPGFVQYLVEAGAEAEVVDAAFTFGPAMLDQNRAAEVAGWIESVHRGPQAADFATALLEIAGLLFGGDPAAARRALDHLGAAASPSPEERVVADLLRTFAALFDGTGRKAAAAATRVLAAVDGADESELPDLLGLTGTVIDVTAAALVGRGVAHLYEGELTAARQDLEGVDDEAHGRWRAAALGGRALVEAWSGNLTAAERLARSSLSLADELGHEAPSRTTPWLALALAARMRGNVDEAANILNELDDVGASDRRPVGLWVATERAHLALATGAAAAATELSGPRAAVHPSMPDAILARRRAVEAHMLLASGDLASAQAALDDGFGRETSETFTARVRLALARGNAVGARALLDDWPAEPQPRADRERRFWTCILDHMDGEVDAASSAMAALVAEVEPEEDLELFQLAGSLAMGLVRAVYRTAPTTFLRTLVEHQTTATEPRPVKGLPEQLTDREYMILAHLPTRQSNAEIAERLGVSLNTVKTHLKHIYRKLDVAGRSEAVGSAERMHLL